MSWFRKKKDDFEIRVETFEKMSSELGDKACKATVKANKSTTSPTERDTLYNELKKIGEQQVAVQTLREVYNKE